MRADLEKIRLGAKELKFFHVYNLNSDESTPIIVMRSSLAQFMYWTFHYFLVIVHTETSWIDRKSELADEVARDGSLSIVVMILGRIRALLSLLVALAARPVPWPEPDSQRVLTSGGKTSFYAPLA